MKHKAKRKTLHVNMAHQLLGHIGERATQEISKHLGWIIVRSSFQPCVACDKAKTKRKALMADRNHEVGMQEKRVVC